MKWLSHGARSLAWAFAIGAVGLVGTVEPLQAENPTSEPSPTQDRQVPAEFAAHLEKRNLEVVRFVESDLDGDGDADIVAHVRTLERHTKQRGKHGESTLLVALSEPGARDGVRIVAEIPNGMLCPDCPIPTTDGGAILPEQEMTVHGREVEICETWGRDWRVGRCNTIALDENLALRVVRHAETTGWQPGPTEYSVAIDFALKEGQRAYSSSPLEAGFPAIEHRGRFALLTASRISEPPRLDGKLDDATWQAEAATVFATGSQLVSGPGHWRGADDLSFTVQARWAGEGVWLAVDVKDDHVVRDDCGERRALMRSDRVELWLDVANDLRVSGNEPWVEEHRRVYHEDPFRHRPDDSLFDLAVGLTHDATCAAQYLPREEIPWLGVGAEQREDQVRAEATLAPDQLGYSVELFLPAALLGLDALDEPESRWPGVGLTVVVHDVDDADRPQDATEMATSTFTWGDPFTLGILVLPRSEEGLPVFPFDWYDWMH